MALLDHVALAIDFSEPSRIALQAMFRLARITYTKKVTVMHSVQEVVLPHGDQPVVTQRLQALKDRIHEAAHKQMQEMIDSLPQPDGVEIAREVVEGSPTRAIPDGAVRIGATMLAVGTHARKGVRRWLKGSVAEAIVRGIEIPVLVMPTGDDNVPPEEELKGIERVVGAVDVHEQADHIVAAAVDAIVSLKEQRPTITLLTVDDMHDLPTTGDDDAALAAGEIRDAIAKDARALLGRLAAKHASAEIVIDARVEQGDPDEVILEVAEQTGAALIVVGTHGRNAAPLLDLGSTACQVLRSSNVSVLVVPSHPEHRA